MDDTHNPLDPVSGDVWLRFSLAFDNSTRLVRLLRQTCPDPRPIAHDIQHYLTESGTGLPERLRAVDPDIRLQALADDRTLRRVGEALNWQAASDDHHLLGLDHAAYPSALLCTEDAPPLLYARGNLPALDYPMLAVVGSRKASHTAVRHTGQLCNELADMGIGIVSGLAMGIDAAAHEGALLARRHNSEAGPTIAIAATAIDRVYPARHASLAERIIENGGLILTEYPLQSRTRPWHFPRRNRLISGISAGVLVAEAALPSGTLTTANHAVNQGREVMAMPGSLLNPQARGCHMLIKNGAALVEDARDVAEVLGPGLSRAQALMNISTSDTAQQSLALESDADAVADAVANVDPDQRALLAALRAGEATLDELLQQTGLAVSPLAALLGTLETRGLITLSAGGRYACCQPVPATGKLHDCVDKARSSDDARANSGRSDLQCTRPHPQSIGNS